MHALCQSNDRHGVRMGSPLQLTVIKLQHAHQQMRTSKHLWYSLRFAEPTLGVCFPMDNFLCVSVTVSMQPEHKQLTRQEHIGKHFCQCQLGPCSGGSLVAAFACLLKSELLNYVEMPGSGGKFYEIGFATESKNK